MIMTMIKILTKISPGWVGTVGSLLLAYGLAAGQSAAQVALPQVHLDAAGLAPRAIEELTGTSIVRYYAQAWRDMAQALESSQGEGLAEEFTGLAKDHLMKRIREQNQTGVHVRIIDHGHQLKAIFYSPDGAEMQLVDHAQLEIQAFDGSKLIDTQSGPRQYMVLMTPGADRWYIRDLEEVDGKR
jgi:hypothetical protein